MTSTATSFIVIDEDLYYQEQQECVTVSLWMLYYLCFCLIFTSILSVIYERQLNQQEIEMTVLECRIKQMGEELAILKENVEDMDNVVAFLENSTEPKKIKKRKKNN
jgi:hypothetical protein